MSANPANDAGILSDDQLLASAARKMIMMAVKFPAQMNSGEVWTMAPVANSVVAAHVATYTEAEIAAIDRAFVSAAISQFTEAISARQPSQQETPDD